MSKMSEIHSLIIEQIEDGEAFEEIAYNLTCEYPVDFSVAMGWVLSTAVNIDKIASDL